MTYWSNEISSPTTLSKLGRSCLTTLAGISHLYKNIVAWVDIKRLALGHVRATLFILHAVLDNEKGVLRELLARNGDLVRIVICSKRLV